MTIVTTFLNPRYSGIINAAQNIMGEITLWESDRVPVFDFFYYTKPKLLFVDQKMINSSFLEAIENIDTKIVMFGNSVPDGLNPDLVCAEPNITPLMKKYLDQYNTVYIKDYVDILKDLGGKADNNISSNVGMLLQDINLTMDYIRFLISVSSLFQLKIIGNKNISIPSFLGDASYSKKLDFMKSIKICLDMDGSRILQNAANGIFTLSLVANSLFPTISFSDIEEKISFYLSEKNLKDKLEIVNNAQKEVLSSGTSFHRLLDILNLLDIDNKKEFINNVKEKINEVQK